jgi:hypothetical protein
MTGSQAENELFAALAAGRIVAIAKDAAGNVVDIPQREWPYLQLFEEQESDVLKHDALDREAAFSEIKLQRVDLKNAWEEYLVEPNAALAIDAYETGAPGRPTSMHLIKEAFAARYKRDESAKSITQEANALANWLHKTHPKAPRVKPKTIKNQLGGEFRMRTPGAQK